MPTPHWAWPLPGQCHGEEPIENSLEASRKAQAGGGGDHLGGWGNNRSDLTPPNCPSPSPAPAKGSCLCTYEWFRAALYREISLNNGVNRKEMGEVGRRGPGSSGGVREGVGLG